MTNLTEETPMINPLQILFKYHLILHLLKPLPQHINVINLLEHTLSIDVVDGGDGFTGDGEGPAFSGEELVVADEGVCGLWIGI